MLGEPRSGASIYDASDVGRPPTLLTEQKQRLGEQLESMVGAHVTPSSETGATKIEGGIQDSVAREARLRVIALLVHEVKVLSHKRGDDVFQKCFDETQLAEGLRVLHIKRAEGARCEDSVSRLQDLPEVWGDESWLIRNMSTGELTQDVEFIVAPAPGLFRFAVHELELREQAHGLELGMLVQRDRMVCQVVGTHMIISPLLL
jgi:hypothetical protein